MPEYVTRDEFEARVGILEHEVEGEKMVTRPILEQTRRNGDDLETIKTRLDRVEARIDGVDRKVDGLSGTVQSLVKSLPAMIADVMREVLKESRRKD